MAVGSSEHECCIVPLTCLCWKFILAQYFRVNVTGIFYVGICLRCATITTLFWPAATMIISSCVLSFLSFDFCSGARWRRSWDPARMLPSWLTAITTYLTWFSVALKARSNRCGFTKWISGLHVPLGLNGFLSLMAMCLSSSLCALVLLH